MAEKRMFSKTIVDSDAFLDMPLSSQALYFHLSMRADDDGFLNNARKIQRVIGASDDDLKLLIMKRFIITFGDGILVIKHWRMNNYLRADRHKPTVYQEELAMLDIKDNGSYTIKDAACLPTGIPYDNQCVTQVSIDKISIDKSSKDICPEPKKSPDRKAAINLILNDKSDYPVYQEKIDEWTELFPAVDVIQELRKMKAWLNDNPSRRKTKRGILRFCSSWLSREQDKGGAYRRGREKNDTGRETKPDEKTWSEQARELAEQDAGDFEGF